MVLATRRGWRHQLAALFEQVTFDIIPITAASARRVGDIYARWGKGIHPASLNYGDCFAYELAESRGCKLLFTGSGFSRTDIPPARNRCQGGRPKILPLGEGNFQLSARRVSSSSMTISPICRS